MDVEVNKLNHADVDLLEKLVYWKQQLAGVTPLELPTYAPRTAIQSTAGARVNVVIEPELQSQLHAFSQQHGVTLFMTLLSAFTVLLYRYSGQTDICLGSPIANRKQKSVDPLVAFPVNTLALRCQLQEEKSFTSLLSLMKSITLDAHKHQDVAFEKIAKMLDNNHDKSRSPVFQVMFALLNTPEIQDFCLEETRLVHQAWDVKNVKCELSLFVRDTKEGLLICAKYCQDLFKLSMIERMMAHYRNLLLSILRAPNTQIAHLPMLGIKEKQQLLDYANCGVASYEKSKTLVDCFQAQVCSTPERAALMFANKSLTYTQLNAKANQLARYLRTMGVRNGELVIICLERSLDMVVAIWGVLKAGGAYVPIDPNFPEERVRYVMEQTQSKFCLVQNSTQRLASFPNTLTISLATDWPIIEKQSNENPCFVLSPDQLAYIIYTSGSTGKPKGVMIEHKNVVRLLKTKPSLFDFNQQDIWTLFHSYCFDISVWEIFGALLHGGLLVVVSKETAIDSRAFGRLLVEHKVTVLNQTPAAFYALQDQLLQAPPSLNLRYVIFGGDVLCPEYIQAWRKQYRDCQMINMYGITETTVHASFKSLTDNDMKKPYSNIGRPIPTLDFYVLDQNRNLLPYGVPGELYVGGAGVARGYLNRSDLTAQRFITSPFDDTNILYRSGDLVRWKENGELEYLCRIDNQVKIRGYRVELEEIATVVRQCSAVAQCVIVVKADPQGLNALICYFVPCNNATTKQLKVYLEAHLPEYMIPSFIIALESLPVTVNGKIDKKALPDPANILADDCVAPRNNIERGLVQIWKNVLQQKKLGIYDSFFELGGHSLLATKIVVAIGEMFDCQISVHDIFTEPCIAKLASLVQKNILNGQGRGQAVLTRQQRPVRIPLSFSQQRLWFIDQLEGSTNYHIPLALRLKGKLNTAALEFALTQLVIRHEVLRTRLKEEHGFPYQCIESADQWKVTYYSFSASSGAIPLNGNYFQWMDQELYKPFDLASDYMIRASIFELSEREFVLFIVIHHIAADGWSMEIFSDELMQLYQTQIKGCDNNLPPLDIQYADYALWQQEYLQGKVLEEKLSYWQEHLSGVEPIQLRGAMVKPAEISARGKMHKFEINAIALKKLKRLSKNTGVTLFMSVLSVFKLLLFRYSGQSDICVGTAVANRTNQVSESLVGCFVNTLAIRTQLQEQWNFQELLVAVKSVTLEAYAHQDVPFEKVVERLGHSGDISRNPLFQIMFEMQTQKNTQIQLPGIDVKVEVIEYCVPKFDLTINLVESKNTLQGECLYRSDLFSSEWIIQMISHFETFIDKITEDVLIPIQALQVTVEKEEQLLLNDFNAPL